MGSPGFQGRLPKWEGNLLRLYQRSDGWNLYNIIFQTFITPDKPSHSEILYRLDISERHYYRLRQQAVNILSIRLWTAPQGCLDAWFEILTLLEG